MWKHLIMFCILLLLTQISIVHAEGNIDLTTFPEYLAEKLGVDVFIGRLIAACIILGLCLFPTLALTRNPLSHLFMGMIALCITTALGWVPVWVLLVISMLVAMLFSSKIRNWISGSGEE